MSVPAKPHIKSTVIIRLLNQETGRMETYAVEWPETCLLTIGDFYAGLPYVHTIEDVVQCQNCVYYGKHCVRTVRLRTVELNAK